MEGESFDYSTKDAEQLTIINSILLEMLCARYISSSADPQEEMKFLKSNFFGHLRSVATGNNDLGRLGAATIKHIEQIIERKGRQYVSVEIVENFDPPTE